MNAHAKKLIAWLRALPARRADELIAAALAAAYVTVLVKTTATLGYARDEGFYFHAASAYERWFVELASGNGHALEQRAVDAIWQVNSEHPPLAKSLFALSHWLLDRKLHLFAMEGTSFRFPGMVLAGLAVGLVYLWGARRAGRLAGFVGALLLAATPRFFYHAHLACFDAPIVFFWSLAVFAYWSAVARGGAWRVALAGVAFGLALATKHNAWFVPFLVLGHVVWLAWRRAADARAGLAGRVGREPHRAAATLVVMLVVGPLVLVALWPWVWHDTLARLEAYARFHLEHEYYNMEFLGRNHHEPPFPRAYAPVMTLATVPLVTLALAAVGVATVARARFGWSAASAAARAVAWVGASGAAARLDVARAKLTRPAWDPGATDLLWAAAIVVSYAAWLSPGTPIFGGTKHWMTAYPFLCLFAGAAAASAWRRVRIAARALAWSRHPALVVVFAEALVLSPIAQTARSHPWGLSYYTPIVGGVAGAATLGLNRGFWGYQTGAIANAINRYAPPHGSVYLHDTAYQAWDMLKRDGRIRRDITAATSAAQADVILYHHEKHMLGQDYQAWVARGGPAPKVVAGPDGVPVIWLYLRSR